MKHIVTRLNALPKHALDLTPGKECLKYGKGCAAD
jgi:hypothetical protein